MKDCKKHYAEMYETRLGSKKCPWCIMTELEMQLRMSKSCSAELRGIMANDISSALDDCVELGMTAADMRKVVRVIIGKAIAP